MPFPNLGTINPTVTLRAEPADAANGVLAPLPAKIAEFKTLADAGTFGEQHTARGSTARVRLIWDTVDDWRIRKALLGYSYVATVAGTRRLHRVTPYRRPYSRSLAYLRDLSMVGMGRKSGEPQNMTQFTRPGPFGNQPVTVGGVYMDTQGWPTGEKIVYDATFGPLPFLTVGSGDAAAWAAAAGEMTRYTSAIREPRPREVRLPAAGYGVEYDTTDPNYTGPGTSAPIGTPVIQTEVEIRYTWHQLPFNAIPEATLAANVGKVNSAVFDGVIFAPGAGGTGFPVATMLFRGWRETEPYPGADGQFYVDLTYIFGFRGGVGTAGETINWHKVLQPNGVYCLMKRSGLMSTVRMYLEADHRNLWVVP